MKEKLLAALKNNEGFDQTFAWDDWAKTITNLDQLKNYYFTADGLEIYFEAYEMGPYSAGTMTAHLSWDDLKEIGLKTTGPATQLDVSVP